MWFTWPSGAGGSLRFHLLLSPRGCRIGCAWHHDPALLMLRAALSSASAGAWSAPHRRICRCHLRGEELRSKSRLPGRSLLPSTILEHVAALRSSRTFDRSARTIFIVTCATLLTLAPTFPTRSGPCDPAAKLGFLSWGCPKIAPPSSSNRRVRLPVTMSPALPPRPARAFPLELASFGMRTPIPIQRAALVVSHHLDGFPPRPRDRIAGRCRSWGSPRFLLSRNRIPRDATAALRSFPSADSYGRRDESRPSAGSRHRSGCHQPSRSPRTLPSHPFALLVRSAFRRSCPRTVLAFGPLEG
jgi:hypothetical protein